MTTNAKTSKKSSKPAAEETEIADGDSCALPTAVASGADEPRRPFRMLTGIDDSSFCAKVSAALEDGYELYGSPTMTFNGANVIVGQAVVLKKKAKKGKRK